VPTTPTRVFDFAPVKIEVSGSGDILIEGEVLATRASSRELPLLLDRIKT
jgi:hypothetical protein